MINKMQSIPKVVYSLFIFTFMLLFFMFYSFGVDTESILENYQSVAVVDKRQSIEEIKIQVAAEKEILTATPYLDNWLKTCVEAKQFLYDNSYVYSLSDYDRPMNANKLKGTNCGDYVLYCLQTAGFLSGKGYTSAKGVAKYCKDAGWVVNTEYANIKDGDIVWVNRGYGHYTTGDLVNSTGESHIMICASFADNLYYNVGGNSSISVPTTTQGSNVSSRFICSFTLPIQ